MKILQLPKTEKFSIKNWESNDKHNVSLKPGDTVRLSDYNSEDIMKVWPQLREIKSVEKKLQEVKNKNKKLEEEIKKTEKVVEETGGLGQEVENYDRPKLMKMASGMGIKHTQSTKELKKQIKEKLKE